MEKKKKISMTLKGGDLYEPVNIKTFTADTQRLLEHSWIFNRGTLASGSCYGHRLRITWALCTRLWQESPLRLGWKSLPLASPWEMSSWMVRWAFLLTRMQSAELLNSLASRWKSCKLTCIMTLFSLPLFLILKKSVSSEVSCEEKKHILKSV